ncbi:MAG: hypothetical protein ACOCTG_06270, partial [Bacteroidota bacterium]
MDVRPDSRGRHVPDADAHDEWMPGRIEPERQPARPYAIGSAPAVPQDGSLYEAPSMGDGHRTTPEVSSPDKEFSPLDLRDRVAIMLLFKQIVTVEQVADTWRQWRLKKKTEREALWRMLARRPEVDRDAIFAEAAEVYAYPEFEVSVEDAIAVVRLCRRLFNENQWQYMRRSGVLP